MLLEGCYGYGESMCSDCQTEAAICKLDKRSRAYEPCNIGAGERRPDDISPTCMRHRSRFRKCPPPDIRRDFRGSIVGLVHRPGVLAKKPEFRCFQPLV